MKPSNCNQDQPELNRENTGENLSGDGKKIKSVKSNSELMAEFFSIVSDEEKKE